MNEIKPGYLTTEFWLSMVSALIVPIFGIVVLRGYLPEEEANLWQAVILAFVPLAMALISIGYSLSRGKVKAGN